MKMLCLARKEEEKKGWKEWNETKPNNNNESTHGAELLLQTLKTKRKKSCPWISYNSGLGAQEFRLKNRWSKTRNEEHRFPSCVPKIDSTQPRRRNQFFISRRKIDNFWFLFSFLSILLFLINVSSSKITSFQEATLGEKQKRNEEKNNQKAGMVL